MQARHRPSKPRRRLHRRRHEYKPLTCRKTPTGSSGSSDQRRRNCHQPTRFRELSRLQHTRLITFTGYGQESDRSRARQVGFHHYLVKSVDLHAIDAVLATAKSLGPQASQQRYICGNGDRKSTRLNSSH